MRRKTLRIVVIDDNPADAGIVRRYLDKIRSFDVDFVHYLNGADGGDAVKRDGTDCVLLDYQLGAVSGMEVLTEIRQSGSDVPIIAVTGQAMRRSWPSISAAGLRSISLNPTSTASLWRLRLTARSKK